MSGPEPADGLEPAGEPGPPDGLEPADALEPAGEPPPADGPAGELEPAPGPGPTKRTGAAGGPEPRIVWRDEHLLVVDKPAGLVVHPARGHREGTLAQLLAGTLGWTGKTGARSGGESERAGIVHRLDRDTSGLMVLARDEVSHARLQAALRRREIEREYVALVEGTPPARSGTIEAPIGRHPRVRTRMAVDGVGAREARTHFTLERRLAETSLLRLRLDTGRTHQIRVHLQAIGHPVCGDPEYGTGDRDSTLGLERQFLHAVRLAFAHPITGERLELSSPLPDDLRAALARAGGSS